MNTLSTTSVRAIELRTRSRFLCLLAAINRPFALTSTPHRIMEARTCTHTGAGSAAAHLIMQDEPTTLSSIITFSECLSIDVDCESGVCNEGWQHV